MRDLLKLSLTLALVCAIAAASLAFTNAVTQPIIAQSQEREFIKSMQRLLPDAERFEEVVEEDVRYFVAWDGSETVGAVVVGEGGGYGGTMQVLVGIDAEGKVKDIGVTEHEETIGIGTRALQPSFLGQFLGKTTESKLVPGKDVDLIQGATISSRAVTTIVSKAMAAYQTYVVGTADDGFDLAKVADGVYVGTAQGFKNPVEVEVTVQGGKITAVKAKHKDTPEVADEAATEIPKRIVAGQNWKVDAVAGATVTSDAIMEAVKAAIPDTSLKIDAVADGTYTAEGEGFNGPVKVSVEVAGGKVLSIKVISHKETEYVSDPAFDGIPAAVIEKQTVEVDTVSGATYTSEALIEAITKALENAPRK